MFSSTTTTYVEPEYEGIYGVFYAIMDSFLYGGTLPLALMPVLFIASFAGLIYLLVRVFRRTYPGLTSCGQCGYAVQGLSTMTCPECGSDFRDVGMVSPLQRKSLGLPAFLLIWTLCFPIPAATISSIIIAYGPQEQSPQLSSSITPNNAIAFERVTINEHEVEVDSVSQKLEYRTLRVDFYDANYDSSGTIIIDPQAGTIQADEYYDATYQLKQPKNRDKHGIDTAGVIAVFEALELDVTNAELRAQAAELAQVFKALPNGPENASSFAAVKFDYIDTTPYTTPRLWFVVAVLIGAALLYPIGIVAFVVLTDLRRQAAAQAHLKTHTTRSTAEPATTV